ncbi:MAG: hypothetical protein GY864_11785 [Desulfobacterales bacterium]|nr:hypothetical protein [Desulfobacterales bacterium]
MISFPDTEKKLRSVISRYKSALSKEKREHGYINDGSGKRYLLFYFYFILDDLNKSQEYFEWYNKEFSDDVGEPIQKLCWALSLYRMKKEDAAKHMLADAMLSNLYLIPSIMGQEIKEYDIWHSSSDEDIDYVEYIPEEIRMNIKDSEIQWMDTLFNSPEFRRIRKRYIEIYHDLQHTKQIEERKKLLNESYSLLGILHQKNS